LRRNDSRYPLRQDRWKDVGGNSAKYVLDTINKGVSQSVIGSWPETFPELQNFWDADCSVFAGKGINVPQFAQLWATKKRESLSKWSGEEPFDELCSAGCSALSLAIAISTIERSQHAAEIWRSAVGKSRRRDQVIAAFLRAADALEEVNESFITAMCRIYESSWTTTCVPCWATTPHHKMRHRS
jgi:hypothetical protein